MLVALRLRRRRRRPAGPDVDQGRLRRPPRVHRQSRRVPLRGAVLHRHRPGVQAAPPAQLLALAQDQPVQGIVALEDLRARDVTFARATRPMTPEQVAAGLGTLAQLHGETWGRHKPRTRRPAAPHGQVIGPDLGCLVRGTPPDVRRAPRVRRAGRPARSRTPARGGQGLPGRRPARPECLVARRSAHRERIHRTRRNRRLRRLAGHRDRDLGITTSTTSSSPRSTSPTAGHTSATCSAAYLKTLASYGVPVPGSGEAWRIVPAGHRVRLPVLAVQPATSGSRRDVNAATFARFGMAMLDHNTYAAIGV